MAQCQSVGQSGFNLMKKFRTGLLFLVNLLDGDR